MILCVIITLLTFPAMKPELLVELYDVARLMRTRFDRWARTYGMTRAQFATLSRLERQDGLAQHELAESLEIQPIAMVRLVDQLSADDLVERRADPADRRCNRLFLTGAGRERLKELADFKSGLGSELFEGIGEDAIREVLETLGQLHSNIKSIQSADAATVKLKKASL